MLGVTETENITLGSESGLKLKITRRGYCKNDQDEYVKSLNGDPKWTPEGAVDHRSAEWKTSDGAQGRQEWKKREKVYTKIGSLRDYDDDQQGEYELVSWLQLTKVNLTRQNRRYKERVKHTCN